MKDDIEFAKAGFNQALRGYGTRPPANVEKRKKAEKTAGKARPRVAGSKVKKSATIGLRCTTRVKMIALALQEDLDAATISDAVALAIVSLLAFAIDSSVLQGVAAVLFVAFCVQGVALVHWMHAQEMLPLGVVISMYILLPLLQVLLVTVLAVFGYMDAWFEFRRRMKKA